jgi:uncharacterized protein with GYD domain
MASYVLLMNLTEQGVRTIKDAPGRAAEGMKAWEAMGGKTLSFHLTMGPYDYVAVVEAPNDEVAAAYALTLASQGNVTTLSMKAFTVEQMGAIVAKLP